MKTNPWTYEIKDLNREKIIESFYKKIVVDYITNELLFRTRQSYQRLKAEFDKLDIAKLVDVPTSLNNLKTKVDDWGVGKLITVPVDLKEFNDLVDYEVVKNTKFNTLKTKVNNLNKKNLDAATLIHINQCNTYKQNLEKKIGDVHKKIPDTSGLLTTTVLNTKISEVENKMSDTSTLTVSCRPFPNILKYRDHQWNLPKIWKTRLLQTLIEEFS